MAIIILLLASLACSSSNEISPDGQNAGEKENKSQENNSTDLQTVTEDVGQGQASDQPSLELSAILGEFPAIDLGEGMQRVIITLAGKNTSSSWWSYGLASFNLLWNDTDCFWSMDSMDSPVLETDTGYTYKATTNTDWNCGPRQVWDVPPGMEFVQVGDSGGFFGYITFDIPVTATPKTISLYYRSAGIHPLSESYEPLLITVPITDWNEWVSSRHEFPFDPAYLKHFPIYKTGEKIPVGNFAEVVVQSPGTLEDNSLPITMTVISLHEGYPLVFDEWDSFTSLVFEFGILRFQPALSTWGWSSNNNIGPLQSIALQAEFQNPGKLKAWLIVTMTLEEVSPAKAESSIHFVVELP